MAALDREKKSRLAGRPDKDSFFIECEFNPLLKRLDVKDKGASTSRK